MSDEHEVCYCCYLSEKYFVTKQSLKYHDKVTHNEHHNRTDNESEDILEMKSNKVNQQQTENKIKKERNKHYSKNWSMRTAMHPCIG